MSGGGEAIGEEALRARVRELLAAAHPDEVDRVTFRRAQYDHGLAWVHFPEGYGGLGLSPGLQAIVDDEIARHARTTYADLVLNPIGIGMGAPTVLAYAPEAYKQALLPRIFTAEDVWCQLFSEPGAGSDVAGLATRAVRDGDDWIVNGQKVWASLAHRASWAMLLARTDPDKPKHDGLSYFLLDMRSPGVEVRPLYQITGDAEFNEVFLNDVRIPGDRILGKEGAGWRVAITTLMNERVAIGGYSRPGQGMAEKLLRLWREEGPSSPRGAQGRSAAEIAVLRDEVVRVHVESELLGITNQRTKDAMRAGTPGPEGSVAKLVQAELNKEITELALSVIGSDALVYETGYPLERVEAGERSLREFAKHDFLRSRANSIEGGTSEVMRNILGERMLGLPGEPRADKDVPWKEIPRGRA
ncbi:MAG: acyl-CoA dehydrogenase family protein [Spirochaetaceae bacterium]|nr:acyl-CoA dehydrogenase family protein [Myxococcales bacterium]MCB9725225.1 acyl-CoA dehydrogenase family protein [Spirochaetaceae bacterium]